MLKKVLATILVLITIIGCLPITQVSNMTVQAEEECPIVSIDIDKKLVSAGETITITVKMKDDCAAWYFSINMPDSAQNELISLNKKSDGVYTGTFSVTENTKPGLWEIDYFSYKTKYNEYMYVYNSELYSELWSHIDFLYDFSPLDFEVVEIDDSATGTVQENYIVVFLSEDDVGGKKKLSTQRVAYGEAATEPSAPTRLYSVFDGWDKDFSNVTSNMIINAKWIDYCMVDFTDGNGNIISTQWVLPGEAATAPASEPTKTNAVFAGWDKDFSSVTSNMVINPTWINKLKVTFTNGNGKVISTQWVLPGEDATAPSAPTLEDFIFDGWDKDFSEVTSDMTVNAKWKIDPSGPYDKEAYVGERMTFSLTTSTAQSFTITCNDKSLELNSDYKCTGTSSVSFGGYTKYSYTYSCYATINTPGVYMIYIKGSAASNTLSYKVKVSEPPEYTVKYDANGGTGAPSAQTKTHGRTLTLSNTKPTKSYTITYNANGGSVSPETKTVSATFSSWNTASNGNGTSYNAGASYTANSGTTLYAQWINPTVGTLPTPTKEGCTFDGWYTAESGGTKVTDSTIISKDTTLYAQWVYSITYDVNGRECAVNSRFPQNQVKKHNENIVISSNRPYCTWTAYDSYDVITCCGATFTGWNTKKDGTGISYKPGDTYSLNENLVLYAQWEFSIRYDTNLGVDSPIPPNTQIKKQGQSVVISSDVPAIKIVTGLYENERKGYRFIGWRSSDNKYFYNPGDIHTDDTSLYLYAQWESIDFNTARLAGTSRCDTAVAISQESFTETTNVILASGDNYADALAGGSLAYALDAPILLVRNNKLDDNTLEEIRRLGVKNIYILGGKLAISDDVVSVLEQNGYKTERIAGASRLDTAVEIAKKLQSISGAPSEVFFAYSHNYPDALAISGIAAIKGCPVLYISADGKLSDTTAQFVSSCGVKKATILGGIVAISADAEENLKNVGPTDVSRIAGTSRYDTCLKINEAYADILTGNCVCIATGLNYPDALAGSVFAAKNKAPMVLVGKELTADQENYIDNLIIDSAYIFGGTGAVSAEVEYDIFN